ncbi:hypothetical protein DCS_05830 [Drechmeria coniospora]|uniref:Subtilisin-like serine protease PR1C n=1 Tax=Drechmeria coniospora TaxID=98403 RepID=A0A151GP86_DRECN|nr:hypothetical protein DCS_05830 [Drechmeria coniospora]KYK58812.1 hypothetical protein DCS_05830 [Drechmeria coniospora]
MVCISLLFLLAKIALTTLADNSTAATDDESVSYIIEAADGVDLGTVKNVVAGAATVVKEFNYKVFRGYTVVVSQSTKAIRLAEEWEKNPAVKRCQRVRQYQTPKSPTTSMGTDKKEHTVKRRHANVADVNSPLMMAQIDMLHAKGYTGNGSRIALVDSGVDYHHDAFGGCFRKQDCLVSFGYDVVDGDKDPMDSCNGHGTSVASIIAAQPNRLGFTGVAPKATLGAYRVVDCKGRMSTAAIIEAYSRAFEDDAHVIVGAFSVSEGFSDSIESSLIRNIVWNGVPCIFAAGNSGETGPFDGNSPGDTEGATSVGFSDNILTPTPMFKAEYRVDGDGAVAHGAKYFITHGTGYDVEELNLTRARIIAAGAVDKDTGDRWVELIRKGRTVTLKMASPSTRNQRISTYVNGATGGAVDLRSSWGPTWTMDQKPDFVAPGGNMLSAHLAGGYAVESGSSNSAPLVAGIVALIREVRGHLDPVTINSLLSSTAKAQRFNDGTKFYDYYAPVAQQGAGLVQAYDAAFVKTLLAPSSLSFNDSDHFVRSQAVTIHNNGSTEMTYRISHVPAITIYTLANGSRNASPFPGVETVPAAAEFKFSQDTIVVKAGQRVTFEAQPTPPSGLNAWRLPLWSGWIVINSTDGTTSLSIPYQGLAGSLRNSTSLDPNGVGMMQSPNSQFIKEGETITLPRRGRKEHAADILPGIGCRLILGSRLMTAHLLPLSCPCQNITTEYWGTKTIGQPKSFPQINNPHGELTAAFDGMLESGNYAPPGRYMIVVRALRIFGNATNHADWDTAVSPSFNIKYQE